MSDPLSYVAIDPSKRLGIAWIGPGMNQPKWETWKFTHKGQGENQLQFLQRFTNLIQDLPDPQIAIELMTIVEHGTGQINAKQVQSSSGWFNTLDMCRAKRGLRPIEQVAIGSWRSKSHGKLKAPKEIEGQVKRRKWLKQVAIDYCIANGWDVANDEEAEALCILEWLRIIYQPGYAFEAGQGHHQIGMDL